MNLTFFKRFFHQLSQNKLYTLINVFGFAVSMMFIILLSLYIRQESSVDQFHINKDRIYRLTSERWGGFSPPVGQWLKDTYPEIENYTRVFDQTGIINDTNHNKISFSYLMVDSSFFNMFSFNVIRGNKQEILDTRNAIVLTSSLAKKIFGKRDPIGKEVVINTRIHLTVTGIVEDFTQNTHFMKCEALLNFPVLEEIWGATGLMQNYGNCSFGLYLLAKENTDLLARKQDIYNLFMKDLWLFRDGFAKELRMEAVTDCYFSEVPGKGITSNNKTFINILTVIVLVILIISLINYINLTIAQSGAHNKEIATKMILGSTKIKLFNRFIAESGLLCLIAFLMALVLALICEPVFNNLLNTNIHLVQKLTLTFFVGSAILIFMIGFISGIVPAYVITRVSPIEVVKGNLQSRNRTIYSKVLISFQFSAVIILLICSWIISKQIKFVQNYDTGFKKDNILVIQNTIGGDQKAAFRDELYKIPGVELVSFVAGSPMDGGNNLSFNYNNIPLSFQTFTVDTNFFSMFGMKVTSTGMAYSRDGMWLNETAIKQTGLEKLPSKFENFNNEPPILGVVKDFNFRNLHEKIGPAMIWQLGENQYCWQILVKISENNLLETVKKIKSTYKDFTNGLPLEMNFADETMRRWYDQEVKTSHIVGYFTILAIIISVLGILAMSLFYIGQRIKEIGIRKVNGAESNEIILMLNTDFVLWVILAFIVACPVAWYAMNRWLENFAYTTKINWWVFAISGFLTLTTALLTISIQTWQAARRNPVESLRYE